MSSSFKFNKLYWGTPPKKKLSEPKKMKNATKKIIMFINKILAKMFNIGVLKFTIKI
jgi:hypothetical protein